MNLVRALKGLWSILFTYTPLYFYSSPLDQEFAWKAPRPDGVEYEWVSEANVDKIQVWKGALGARRFRMWLNRGDLGTFALIDGEVVAYTWCLIKLSPWTLSCLHEPIEVGDAYHGRGETKKGFRRRGINSYTRVRLQRYLREHYQDKGVKRMCGTTVTEGAMIVGSIEKQGYVKSQEMILVRLLYFVFILCTWDLLPNGNKKRPGRLSIKFRIPEVFWDPILVAARNKVRSWLDIQLPSDR
jgi:hypothetical protein